MEIVRRAIRGQVLGLFGSGSSRIELDHPRGDPGLFGPGSAIWIVHADFTTMMIGGIAALLLQMLHPAALAGVWDHSNFREDRSGRLRRTAQFIAGTTYGGRAEAMRLIAKVRAIHDRVSGTLPDGTAYSANDPHLLAWVHAAEAYCFLEAYRRYRDPLFPAARQDAYFGEVARIAGLLGAVDPPASRAGIDTFFTRIRPELRVDGRTQEVARALLDQPAERLAMAPFGKLAMAAAIDLLPRWARDLHGFDRSVLARPPLRLGVHGVGTVLRWALADGSAARARRRVG